MRILFITVIMAFAGSSTPAAAAVAPRPRATVIDFGSEIPSGVVLTKQKFKGNDAFTVSLFLGRRAYQTIPVQKEIYDGLGSRLKKITKGQARALASANAGCPAPMTIAEKFSKKFQSPRRYCLTGFSKADRDAVARWYSDVRRLFPRH